MRAEKIDGKMEGAVAQASRRAMEMLSRFGENAALTAEFRLWWPNNQIGVMTGWLNEKGILLDEPVERTDIYCRTENPELNIKRRGGERLEIKSYAGELPLADCIAGEDHAEFWIKHAPEGRDFSTNGRIAIRKKRWLSCLHAAGDCGDRARPSGCQVELSEVQPQGSAQVWTSFCLETSSEPEAVPDSLHAALRKLGQPPCANERPLIASYAQWLLQEDYFDIE